MADRVGVHQRGGQGGAVGHVGPGEAHAVGQRGGQTGIVGGGQQRVEDVDLVAAGQQQLGDVTADEPGAAGEQDAHQGVTSWIVVSVAYASRPSPNATTP